MTRPLHIFLAASLFLLPATAALALHRKTPASMEITHGQAGTIGTPRWGGYRFVVFDSDGDLLNNGSSGRQVFLFDLRERALRGRLALHQLTTGTGDNRRPSTGRNRRKVVYDSLVSGVRQLRYVDGRSAIGGPLTHGSADSWNARVSDNERFVVFESNADLLGRGIPGTQIYLVDLREADPSCPFPCAANANLALTQVTTFPGGAHNAVVDRGAGVVAFESDADPLGTGDDETQVYVAFPGRSQVIALSHGPGASRHPSIARNGRRVAFESDADLLGNGSTGTQIFVSHDFSGAPDQVTFSTSGASTEPSLASNGRALLFTSTAPLVGPSNGGPEIFQYDIGQHALQRITEAGGTTGSPAYSAGVFTAFVADGDLLGTGAPGQELYFVNLFALGTNILP